MEQVRLNLDDLEIQSFATTETAIPQRGTVHANAVTDPVECPTADPAWETCWSCDTCESACQCISQGHECGNDSQMGDTYLASCCRTR